jgi:hypothetical protein
MLTKLVRPLDMKTAVMPLPLGESVGNRKVVAGKVAGNRISKSNGVQAPSCWLALIYCMLVTLFVTLLDKVMACELLIVVSVP